MNYNNARIATGILQEEIAGVVARVESLRGRMGESARGWRGCLRVCWRNHLTIDF